MMSIELKRLLIVVQLMVHLTQATTRLPLEVFEVIRTSRSASTPVIHELLLIEPKHKSIVESNDDDQTVLASEVLMSLKSSGSEDGGDEDSNDGNVNVVQQKRHHHRQHEKVLRRSRQMADLTTNSILPKILYQVGVSKYLILLTWSVFCVTFRSDLLIQLDDDAERRIVNCSIENRLVIVLLNRSAYKGNMAIA